MKITAIVFGCLLLCSCGNPYLNPETSKALSEQQQLEEHKKQTALIERQTKALETIAEYYKNQR